MYANVMTASGYTTVVFLTIWFWIEFAELKDRYDTIIVYRF